MNFAIYETLSSRLHGVDLEKGKCGFEAKPAPSPEEFFEQYIKNRVQITDNNQVAYLERDIHDAAEHYKLLEETDKVLQNLLKHHNSLREDYFEYVQRTEILIKCTDEYNVNIVPYNEAINEMYSLFKDVANYCICSPIKKDDDHVVLSYEEWVKMLQIELQAQIKSCKDNIAASKKRYLSHCDQVNRLNKSIKDFNEKYRTNIPAITVKEWTVPTV